MIIAKEQGKKFQYYVEALRGQFGNDLNSLVFETNKEVFRMRNKQTDSFMSVPIQNLQVGKFYLILYNFNGNKLYCPIFVIDYRVTDNNKHVIYAMNLDYLPFNYKLMYFSKMYELTYEIFKYNEDAPNFMAEQPIKVDFETIYKTLEQNGGYNYSISAFDVLKIKECFGISTNLMYITLHIQMRQININLMKELSKKYENGSEESERLNKIVEKLEGYVVDYEKDVKDYYKDMKNIEANYKLFKN
jgi:hypothetical protein